MTVLYSFLGSHISSLNSIDRDTNPFHSKLPKMEIDGLIYSYSYFGHHSSLPLLPGVVSPLNALEEVLRQ